jgi:uncharacterized sulfatase
MADVASLMKPRTLEKLKEGLKDDDSAVRYWAAMGLLMRGEEALRGARKDLRAALGDQSPTVRIIAARALGEYGNKADLKLVLPVLEELAPPDTNGAYVSILDLNAIAALGEKAAPLMETIKNMPTKDPAAVGRANSYVGRLVQSLVKADGGK